MMMLTWSGPVLLLLQWPSSVIEAPTSHSKLRADTNELGRYVVEGKEIAARHWLGCWATVAAAGRSTAARQLTATLDRRRALDDDDDGGGNASAKFSESDQWDRAVLRLWAADIDDVGTAAASASWRRRSVGGRRSDARSRGRACGAARSAVSRWK